METILYSCKIMDIIVKGIVVKRIIQFNRTHSMYRCSKTSHNSSNSSTIIIIIQSYYNSKTSCNSKFYNNSKSCNNSKVFKSSKL